MMETVAPVRYKEVLMSSRFPSTSRLAVLLACAAGAIGVASPAEAAPKRPVTTVSTSANPNVVYLQGTTRLYVSKRSWLDGGTEVNPGDRKFTDYAYPPSVGYPSFARENNNRPIDRQPLPTPADLGGYPQNFPLY